MIVSVSGFGNSGSGALLDYLKQYEDIYVFDKTEFQMLHEIDGISDLKYHLCVSKDRIASNGAIYRFKNLQSKGKNGRVLNKLTRGEYRRCVDNYIGELTKIKWLGKGSTYDPVEFSAMKYNIFVRSVFGVFNKMFRLLGLDWNFPKKRQRYLSIIDDSEFDKITADYIRQVFDLLNANYNGISVFDQLFSVTNHTQGREFFEKTKTIIVIRDPRDIYIASKTNASDSRFMPCDDVKTFIEYYKLIISSIMKSDTDTILVIRYEDLIYRYFKTTQLVQKYLNIQSVPSKEFTFFNPNISLGFTHNISLYKKYSKDIYVIEKELSRYLYDFESALSPLNDLELQSSITSKLERV